MHFVRSDAESCSSYVITPIGQLHTVSDFLITYIGSVEHVVDTFNLGREWIVRGFAQLTADAAHAFWKRIQ